MIYRDAPCTCAEIWLRLGKEFWQQFLGCYWDWGTLKMVEIENLWINKGFSINSGMKSKLISISFWAWNVSLSFVHESPLCSKFLFVSLGWCGPDCYLLQGGCFTRFTFSLDIQKHSQCKTNSRNKLQFIQPFEVEGAIVCCLLLSSCRKVQWVAISYSLSHMWKCGQIFIATKGNLWAILKSCSFMASPSSFPTVKFVEQLFWQVVLLD
jgi:hypothetical protein